MRTIPHLAAAAIVLASSGAAQTAPDGVPIIIPSQSSIYNQNAVNLPSPPIATGQDVVRGVSGATCQSAINSAGAYFDVGVIGSQDVFNRDTAAVYGRLVVPLGERPKRLDCTKLYELEITRLKMELDLLRLGAPVRAAAVDAPAVSAPHPASPRQAARIEPGPVAYAPARAPAPTRKPALHPKTVSVMPAKDTDCDCGAPG